MSGIAAIAALTGLAESAIWAAFAVFLRVGAMMALLPGFGEQVVPMRVRLALAVAFTAVVLPAVAAQVPPPDRPAALIGAEVVAGLILGLGFRLLVLGLQTAGTIAAQASSLAQLFGGVGPEPMPAVGNLLVMAALALAMAAGLHVQAARLAILSYDILPAGHLAGAGEAAQWGLARVSQAFALAVTLAAPFVAASFLYNLALGVINRAMPQLMVAFVGAPAMTLGGLALLALAAPLLLGVWLEALSAHVADPFGISP